MILLFEIRGFMLLNKFFKNNNQFIIILLKLWISKKNKSLSSIIYALIVKKIVINYVQSVRWETNGNHIAKKWLNFKIQQIILVIFKRKLEIIFIMRIQCLVMDLIFFPLKKWIKFKLLNKENKSIKLYPMFVLQWLMLMY